MTITLDIKQSILLEELSQIAIELNKPKSLFKFFNKNNLKSGIYLFGPVGTGKTMLMNSFSKSLTCQK